MLPLTKIEQFLDMVPLQVIHRFNILQAVPISGSVSYEEIASNIGLHVIHLRRLLRLAMASGFLDETQDGRVKHNASSAMLLRTPLFSDILGVMSEFMFKASTGLIDAIQLDPALREPNATGFNVAFQTDKDFLRYLDSKPEAARMFSKMMKGMTSNPGFSHDHIVRGYKWSELGKATVVDVNCLFLFTLHRHSCSLHLLTSS